MHPLNPTGVCDPSFLALPRRPAAGAEQPLHLRQVQSVSRQKTFRRLPLGTEPSQKLQPVIEEAVSLSASARLRALRVSVVKTVTSAFSVSPSHAPYN